MLNATVKRSLLIQRLLGLRQAHLAQGPLVAWALILVALVACHSTRALGASTGVTVHSATQQYCVSCHDADSHKGGLNLANLLDQDLSQHTQDWEKVVRKLRTRQMPPIGKDRPSDREYERLISQVSESLDSIAVRHPRPGRTETFRRLNRTEYQNAIRDLLALNIDASTLLPNEDPSHGFDNVTVGNLSPTLLNRYIAAAEKISRLAVGADQRNVGVQTFRVQPDLTQEESVEELPLGTRGGALLHPMFPREGEYEIQVRLTRDRNEEVEGLRERHEMEILLDRVPVKRFSIDPPSSDRNFEKVDAHLKLRIPVSAGAHGVGVTFLKNPSSLVETKRQPYQARYNMHRHPRLTPAVYQISITGPFGETTPGDTPSRRILFASGPKNSQEEESCAERSLAALARRALRRPVEASDLEKPMAFYRQARESGGYDAGIEAGLSALLIHPEFLFRVERQPAALGSNAVYRISDVALASRLSFFLWSSIPDESLLSLAERKQLSQPRTLEKEVWRMLADPRAQNLAHNFAGQWLRLRNLDTFTPDLRLYPDFDDNLRQAFRRETELHFETMIRENSSVLELLKTDHTFLNERLAKHYGVPHIYGSAFRRVELPAEAHRGGILRQGSVLTVTSYATRTSPVLRGNWVLASLLASPAPPPPANVPNLKENTVASSLPMRERLSQHRANAACASCHNLMDPIGFALENFDAIGRWRSTEDGVPIDATGGLPDLRAFNGVEGLEEGLLKRPEVFVSALTESLLTFALGRGVEIDDAPAIRRIVRDVQSQHFRFASLIHSIVRSAPFTLRQSL